MKVIGTGESGTLCIVLNAGDRILIRAEAPTESTAPTSKQSLSREKTCAICGKPFTDESITNSLKTCSPECQLALKRQTKNRLRGGPTVTRKQAAPAKLARAGTIDRRQMLMDAAKRVGLITEAGSREVEKLSTDSEA